MAAPNEKLAASLAYFKRLQASGRRVFQSGDLSRVHRERLLANGFLRKVMKGWLISSSPYTDRGDSTPLFSAFWEFCAAYCTARFGSDWHLSPEQSLLLHAEESTIPRQLTIYSPKGSNNKIDLHFGISLFDFKADATTETDLTKIDGLYVFTPESALIKVSAGFYRRNPIEVQLAMSRMADTYDVLKRLIAGGHSTVAGRLVGAYRRIGRAQEAERILRVMRSLGYDIRENDPFQENPVFCLPAGTQAPIVDRMQLLWESMRGHVIEAFPPAPGLPKSPLEYLSRVDDIFQYDAYHSLSIEGYNVEPELIERVRTCAWNPETSHADRMRRDALAARGYWQAFELVREAVGRVIVGGNPAETVKTKHPHWYLELFQPCAAAGLITVSDLVGYRNEPVFLRDSRHVPPRSQTVRDAMSALICLLEREESASVKAVLGHWLFGYVHPYPDGNGRMARFIMNVMLASGGYPWTVIRMQDRGAYLSALERASVDQDIEPFARFVAQCVRDSMTQRT